MNETKIICTCKLLAQLIGIRTRNNLAGYQRRCLPLRLNIFKNLPLSVITEDNNFLILNGTPPILLLFFILRKESWKFLPQGHVISIKLLGTL